MYKCIVCQKEIVEANQDYLWLRDDRIIGRGMTGLHKACAQPATPDENEILRDVEQLRDIWCGRLTYNDDGDWLDNVEATLMELCAKAGLAFASQSPATPREELE